MTSNILKGCPYCSSINLHNVGILHKESFDCNIPSGIFRKCLLVQLCGSLSICIQIIQHRNTFSGLFMNRDEIGNNQNSKFHSFDVLFGIFLCLLLLLLLFGLELFFVSFLFKLYIEFDGSSVISFYTHFTIIIVLIGYWVSVGFFFHSIHLWVHCLSISSILVYSKRIE